MRQPGRVADVAVGLVDPVGRLGVADRPAVEGRVEQRVPDRSGQSLPSRLEAAQVRDEVAVVGVRSLERERRRLQRVGRVLAERSVQLLVGLLERRRSSEPETLSAAAACRAPARARDRRRCSRPSGRRARGSSAAGWCGRSTCSESIPSCARPRARRTRPTCSRSPAGCRRGSRRSRTSRTPLSRPSSSTRLEEEVGIAEVDERRRPVRVGVDHVQRRSSTGSAISSVSGTVIGIVVRVTYVRVERGQGADISFERAHLRVGRARAGR